MTDLQPPADTLANLSQALPQRFVETCQQGYQVLGRTKLQAASQSNPWQFGQGYPPSYPAQGRYRFLRTLAIALELQPMSILEVAAGGGFNGACLYAPGRRVVLNDLRPFHQELQQWTVGDQLELVVGDLFNLSPEQLGHFDLVMACEVLEHVAHGDRFLRHLRQFLSPQGQLLLTTPNGAYFRSRLPTYSQIQDFSALEQQQFQPDADGHLYLYTPAEITQLLQAEHFTDIQVDLSITPWLSGHAGFRFLPSGNHLTRFYDRLEQLTRQLGVGAQARLCSQMIICARPVTGEAQTGKSIRL